MAEQVEVKLSTVCTEAKALRVTDRRKHHLISISRTVCECPVLGCVFAHSFGSYLQGDRKLLALTEPVSIAARPRSKTSLKLLEPTESYRVPNLGNGAVPGVRIASRREELLAAYRLVFRRYSESGFLSQKSSDIVYSPEFAHADSRTLIVVSPAGEVTATATIVTEPATERATDESVIPWRIIRSADPQRRLAGVTCMACADGDSGSRPAAFFALTRFLFQYAQYCQYDGLAITIHPRQVRFYQRICPLVPLSSVYSQEKLGGALAVACRIDLDGRSLSRVASSVLSWFESPISSDELCRPGISLADSAFLVRYADNSDYEEFSSSATRMAG